MILKKSVIILCIAWIDGVFGSSYSKVYVNSGTNAGPYQYVDYGAPAAAYSPMIAQLSAAPVQSVVPYSQAASFVAPCVSPCVPQQAVAQVASAPLVTYTAPKAPVAVAGDVPSNYEYSYVVYDDRTGDQKAARELSDGSVTRGQYSFLQPDGYVRKVQYTADDVTGFNAVVNYLLANGDKTVQGEVVKPCVDAKPEALKQDETQKKDTSSNSEEFNEVINYLVGNEDITVEGEEPHSEDNSSVPVTILKGEENKPSIDAKLKAPKQNKTREKDTSPDSEEINEVVNYLLGNDDITVEGEEPHSGKNASVPVTKKSNLKPVKEPATTQRPKNTAEAAPSGKAVSVEVTKEKPQASKENAVPAVVESVQAPPTVPAIVTNTLPVGYFSYDQLLKCIQKMQIADQRVNSPLTYILLPSNYKPC